MASSEKAYKFSKTPPERDADEVWIPKSQIEHLTRRAPDGRDWVECEVTIPEWLALEKGLI